MPDWVLLHTLSYLEYIVALLRLKNVIFIVGSCSSVQKILLFFYDSGGARVLSGFAIIISQSVVTLPVRLNTNNVQVKKSQRC